MIAELIKADKAIEYDVNRLEYLLNEIDRLEDIHKGEYDVLHFGMTYFSDDGNEDNADNLIPSGVNVENAAYFHKTLCGLLDDVVSGRQRNNVAWACPRGHAKTAWLTNIFLIHQVVYRHRKYIVAVSETTDVAGDFITWGRYQLKLNDKLRRDYGELLDVRPSKNATDNKYEFITTTNTKVEAKGLQVQMRGLRHGNTRPDLFILDDLESKETTNTPEQIEKSKAWFRDEMLPAMSKKGIVIYLGTILCFDSLLDYVLKERKDFESRRFAAVERFADNEALWDEWRRIYREDSTTAAKDALEFYKAHENEMLEGAEILWPGYWSYYEFMEIRENDGIKSFNQEYQNNPTDEERQIFKPESFAYFYDSDLDDKELRFFGAIDMAMGKNRGDYSVIVTMAKNVKTGICYVVDIYMERIHPDELIRQAVRHTMQYQYEVLAVESQAAQEFFADKLSEELERQGYPSQTRLKKVKQTVNKGIRIESLLPDIQSGRIRFKPNQKNALEQFEMYPMHAHDDVPDAVKMCYDAAKGNVVVVRTVQKRMR